MSELGERIRAERIKAGMSQAELAEKIGLHYSVPSAWETGRAKPRNIKSLASALNIPVEYLTVGRSDNGAGAEEPVPAQTVPAARVVEEKAPEPVSEKEFSHGPYIAWESKGDGYQPHSYADLDAVQRAILCGELLYGTFTLTRRLNFKLSVEEV